MVRIDINAPKDDVVYFSHALSYHHKGIEYKISVAPSENLQHSVSF